MTRNELAYLTNQVMKSQGIDPEVINEAVQLFISANSEKISSLEYSEQGLANINKLIGDWKDTKIGQKFLPQQQTQPDKPLSLKEITSKINDGSLKFEQNY